jgi:hypothetical protein
MGGSRTDFFGRSKNRNIRNIRTKLIKPTFLQEHYRNITRGIGTLGNCDIMSAIPLATSSRGAKDFVCAWAYALATTLRELTRC